MEGLICIKDIAGNDLLVKGDLEGKFISVLECGYVILKDGTFIILGNDHGESLTEFYAKYHNVSIHKKMTTQDAIVALANEGFVVYLGTKRSYIREENDIGFAVLYLIKNLTEEQKISCKKLLSTNKKILNPNEKKLNIEYGNGVDLLPYTEDKVREILSEKTIKYIKKYKD